MRYLPYIYLTLVALDTFIKELVVARFHRLWSFDPNIQYEYYIHRNTVDVNQFIWLGAGLGVSLVLGLGFRKLNDLTLSTFFFSSILAGVGNVTELVVRGGVVDYIYLGSPPSPYVFLAANISDVLWASTYIISIFVLARRALGK